MKPSKQGKLISNQLDKELSDFEGRGSRSPRAYISSKSYLPKVLLTSNPLVERDLQRELHHIASGRLKRQKLWEWNQRHFLVSQIFDPDYNLRFTKESLKYSNNFINAGGVDVKSGNNAKSRRDSAKNGDAEDMKGQYVSERRRSKVAGLGLGVFMPPLHPSQRLIEKAKIPNQTVHGNSKATHTQTRRKSVSNAELNSDCKDTLLIKHTPITTTNNNNSKVKAKFQHNPFGYEDEEYDKIVHFVEETTINDFKRNFESEQQNTDISHGSILRRQNTVGGYSSHDTHSGRSTLRNEEVTSPTIRKVSKSASLPEIPVYASATLTLDNDVHESISDIEEEETKNSYEEVLCQDDVLTGVTRSLPLSVMIKANQNINKEVQKQKDKMIQQCIKERDKDSFSDPRWLELNKVLISNNEDN